MSLKYMCDDCGEIIEQIRIVEQREATAITKEGSHDRCFSCALAYLAELTENSITHEFVNPTLDVAEADGKVC